MSIKANNIYAKVTKAVGATAHGGFGAHHMVEIFTLADSDEYDLLDSDDVELMVKG